MPADILESKNKLTIVISLAVFLLLSLMFLAGALQAWDLRFSDSLYREKTPSDSIIIIAIDDKSLQEIGRFPWPRTVFAKAIENLGQSKVIGIDVSFFEKSENPIDDLRFAQAIKNHGRVVLASEYSEFDFSEEGFIGTEKIEPIEILGGLAGHVNLFTSADGITREFPPFIQGTENIGDSEHFAIKVSELFLGENIDAQSMENKMLINFYGGPESFRYISFSDVYSNRISPEEFEGKIILIGSTAQDLRDIALVPVSNRPMPGVEINANIIQTILTQDYIFRQDLNSVIFVIFLFSAVSGIALNRFRILFSTVILAFAIFFYIIISYYLFEAGIVMSLLYPVLSLISVYVIMMIAYYLSEARKRKRVTNIFGKYVSKEVANEILKTGSGESIRLGGSRRLITILFADIRGFTSISEKLTPEEVVNMLNTYLEGMTKSVFKYGGTLDKFIGDAVMAVFNAPLDQEDHALRAIRCALDMQASIKKTAKQKGVKEAQYGIGINTGHAVVGNIGSEERLEYTAIGDSVNLASRLCGQAEGGQIVIGEETWNLVKDKIKTKKIGQIKVKGKEKAVTVYEVVGLRNKQ